MKTICFHYLILLTLVILTAQNVSFSETQGKDTPSVEIKDAQDTTSQTPPAIEVHVKDNKTQQTSSFVINPNERVLREIQEIKISLQQIQQTLDYLVNHVIADLEAENQQLKATLQSYGINPLPQDVTRNTTSPYIPGGPAKNDTPIPLSETEMKPKQKVPADIPQEFSFRIIEEWGRSPEVVRQMNTNAPSIKGIIGVVPPGSSREQLQELARELRAKYDEYDNINIEVFDDETSAKEYIEKNIKNREHNVLSISKHKDSGTDNITIYGVNESSLPTLAPESPEE